MGKKRNAYSILVGKPEGKRSVGRHTRRREGDIKMDNAETEWGHMDGIHLAQDRNQWRAL
jgi:hypothetical protein